MRPGVAVGVASSDVLAIVERTRAIRWWIDKQIEKGHTDEEIESMLPSAVGFITGRTSESELLSIARGK